MRRMYLLLFIVSLVSIANSANLLIDNFESYGDDGALQEAWTYSKAGGPDGLFAWLETNDPAEGSQSLMLDVDMPEKWWHNIVKKEIPGAPIDLSGYLSIQFQFAGDTSVDPNNFQFFIFFYDSKNRVINYQVPAANITNPDWQNVSLSIDSFTEQEWDAGHDTAEPDADRTDIVQVGLMFVGNDDNQVGVVYVDDIQLKEKPDNLLVDNFESYADDDQLLATWSRRVAGGPEGIFASIDKTNTPPQGSNAILLDVNMPEKWWHNIYRRNFDIGNLNLGSYAAVEFWFYGDADVVPGETIFTVFLYDAQDRIKKFALPNEVVTNPSWQKLTLSLANFQEEEWDAGNGTATPDADPANIVSIGLMCVGDVDNQVATFYVDDIQFISKLDTSSVSGTVLEDDAPLAGVTVYAVEQNSILTATTNEQGIYTFPELSQGKQYRILPVYTAYDFEPGAALLTLLDAQYTQDFTAALSVYNRLETSTISDQFDAGGLNPSIIYRGAREWGHDEAGDVRPVIDVTVDKTYIVNFPDSTETEALMPAIVPNSLSGASSPNYALEVGGFYSWDMLAFGQNSDRNYFVEVDAFCDVRYDTAENSFDRVTLAIHTSFADPDKPSVDAYADTNANRTSGGYALSYESDSGEIIARKYAPNSDTAHARGRLAGFATDYGKVTLTDSGWHRFRIEFVNDEITFLVDGQQVAQANDAEYPFGPAGLHYRACYTSALEDLGMMNHARFDNLKAGPTAFTGIENWMLN